MSQALEMKHAILDNKVDRVKSLIENGFPSNGTMAGNWTPLVWAACQGRAEIIDYLVQEAGVDVNECTADSCSAVFISAQKNHPEILKYLISKGADINLPDYEGCTPVFIAAQKNNVRCLQLLVEKGADVNVCLNNGASPVYVAALNNCVEALGLLVSAGADVNVCKNDGASPAFVAAQNNCVAALGLLVSAGADVNVCKNDGVSPAFVAAQNNCVAALGLLVSAGGPTNPPVFEWDGPETFDGTNDIQVDNSSSLQLTGDFTISIFAYPTSYPSGWSRIIGKGSETDRNYGLILGTDLKTIAQVKTSSMTRNADGPSLSLNTWTHIALVHVLDSSLAIYVNGLEYQRTSISGVPVTDDYPLTIGNANCHSGYSGLLKLARVYNTALSPNEIKILTTGCMMEMPGDEEMMTEPTGNEKLLQEQVDQMKAEIAGLKSQLHAAEDRGVQVSQRDACSHRIGQTVNKGMNSLPVNRGGEGVGNMNGSNEESTTSVTIAEEGGTTTAPEQQIGGNGIDLHMGPLSGPPSLFDRDGIFSKESQSSNKPEKTRLIHGRGRPKGSKNKPKQIPGNMSEPPKDHGSTRPSLMSSVPTIQRPMPSKPPDKSVPLPMTSGPSPPIKGTSSTSNKVAPRGPSPKVMPNLTVPVSPFQPPQMLQMPPLSNLQNLGSSAPFTKGQNNNGLKNRAQIPVPQTQKQAGAGKKQTKIAPVPPGGIPAGYQAGALKNSIPKVQPEFYNPSSKQPVAILPATEKAKPQGSVSALPSEKPVESDPRPGQNKQPMASPLPSGPVLDKDSPFQTNDKSGEKKDGKEGGSQKGSYNFVFGAKNIAQNFSLKQTEEKIEMPQQSNPKPPLKKMPSFEFSSTFEEIKQPSAREPVRPVNLGCDERLAAKPPPPQDRAPLPRYPLPSQGPPVMKHARPNKDPPEACHPTHPPVRLPPGPVQELRKKDPLQATAQVLHKKQRSDSIPSFQSMPKLQVPQIIPHHFPPEQDQNFKGVDFKELGNLPMPAPKYDAQGGQLMFSPMHTGSPSLGTGLGTGFGGNMPPHQGLMKSLHHSVDDSASDDEFLISEENLNFGF